MRIQFSKFALAAGFGLALAFNFGCSSDDGGSDGGKISSSPSEAVSSSSFLLGLSSSSLFSSEILCLYNGVCIPIIFESCFSIGGQVVEICPVASSSSFTSSSSNSSVVASSSSEAVFSSSSISLSSSSIVLSSSSSVVSSSSLVVGSSSSSAAIMTPSSSSILVVSNCPLNGRTVTIGEQVWMKENLNCDVSGSKCLNNDPANCVKYGRLYDWTTAMALPASCQSSNCYSQIKPKHQGICPSGWHIPSNEDWNVLMFVVGGYSTAGRKLKATSGWEDCGPVGSDNRYICEDAFGFSALPSGIGYSDGGWWSASEASIEAVSEFAYTMSIEYDNDGLSTKDGGFDDGSKSLLLSVRCLQD